jgi:hypothetical protein
MTAFRDRADRLAEIVGTLDLAADYPLLKAVRLPAAMQKRLSNAVNLYLYATLDSYYSDRTFDLNDEFLQTAAAAIRELPNITPNGLILAKKQNYLAYNMVHAVVADIFESLGLPAHVSSIHAPINLRLVDGADRRFDARPRASVKWHSDMWAGEPAAAVICFLPVFGVPGTLGVRWVEPRAFPKELARPLDDFHVGKDIIAGGKEYHVAFDPGVLILSDPFLVHATQRDTSGLRLSIDFRFIARQPVASDAMASGTRSENYLPYSDWANIGRSHVLTTEAPLAPYTGPDNATSNEYAAPFKIRRLGD